MIGTQKRQSGADIAAPTIAALSPVLYMLAIFMQIAKQMYADIFAHKHIYVFGTLGPSSSECQVKMCTTVAKDQVDKANTGRATLSPLKKSNNLSGRTKVNSGQSKPSIT